jgi:hypothetical protein
MADIIGKVDRKKMFVVVFTKSAGQVNFTTMKDTGEIRSALLRDRKMANLEGIDDFGRPVDILFETDANAPYEIVAIAIREQPSGKVVGAMPAPGGRN